VHGRVTGKDHSRVLTQWARLLRQKQIDPASGLLVQRMDAWRGSARNLPVGETGKVGAQRGARSAGSVVHRQEQCVGPGARAVNARAALTWVRGSRALRRIAALVVTYVVLGLAFSFATRSRGLLSPGGSPHPDVIALGIVYLVTRITVRFVLPGLAAYLIAASAIERIRRALSGG